MKKTALILSLLLCGCMEHPEDTIENIEANETAFLVSLDGDTKTNQAKFSSIKAVEEGKVAGKRVIIPHKLIDKCPECFGHSYEDVATVKLIKINRLPVSREWTKSAGTGTSAKDQALSVESNESIDFDIGATITAHVSEEDAAKFLYFYSGRQLEQVVDENIRSFLASSVSGQMGSNPLDWDRANKQKVSEKSKKEAQEFFASRGITIDNFGFVEGMTYRDRRIQDAINKNFESQMQVEAAKKQKEAAEILAGASEAVKVQQGLEMRKRDQELQQAAIAKWDGVMPHVWGASGTMFNIPISSEKK